MKRSFFSILLGVILFPLCSAQVVRVENFNYEVANDVISIKINVFYAPHLISSRQEIILSPFLQGEGTTEFLPEVYLVGSKQYKAIQREQTLNKKSRFDVYRMVNAGKSGNNKIEYKVSLPYEKWMGNSEFSVLLMNNEKRGSDEGTILFTSSVAYQDPEPLPVPVIEVVSLQPEVVPERKPELVIKRLEGVVHMDFLPGKEHPGEYFSNNENEPDKIKNDINTVIVTPGAKLRGVFLTGYSSIEGSFADNEQLSKMRVQVLRDYLLERYPELSGKIVQDWKGEDWKGLIERIEKIEIPYKTEVLTIIRNTRIFEGREKKLMELKGGVPYHYMIEHLFPELRRIEYIIEYEMME